MARPLSEEKRTTILKAAAKALAEIGIGASTARIASMAGVSEGTIFTYFATKDELLNQLYLEIKDDLVRAMLNDYPRQGSLRERIQHVWDGFIGWGFADADKRKAMKQLAVYDRISAESRVAGSEPFREINALLAEGFAKDAEDENAAAFGGSLFEAAAETTLEFMAREPGRSEHYKRAGFDFLLNGIGI